MLKYIIILYVFMRITFAGCDADCLNCNTVLSKCITCGNSKALFDGKCLDSCPLTYYMNINKNNECTSCSNPCRECTTSSNNCVTCTNPLWFLQGGTCVDKCQDNYIATYNVKQSFCQSCNAKCKTCLGNADNCTSCKDETQSIYLGTCIDMCPQGSFSQVVNDIVTYKKCVNCISSCQSCNNQSTCVQCNAGYFLLEDASKCVQKCPSGFQQDVIYRKCYRTSCPSGTFDITYTDESSQFLGAKQCSNTCPNGYYIDSKDHKCIKCHASCTQCTGPLANDCLVCDKTCLTCAGSNFDQCLSCTTDRQLYKKFNQPVGECVCPFDTTEQLKEVCENSAQTQQMKNALTGLTATNFILSVLISFFTQNAIFVLRYIDFSQTISYLGYITFKYPLQMDRILKIYDHFNIGYLLPKPNQFADQILISNEILQNNPYDSQLEYKGNPLFFVNERLPFLIINAFSYFIIYIVCIAAILIARYIIYPITQNEKVKVISQKMPHTIFLNIVILTSQEMVTHTFIQYANIQYKNNSGISIVSSILAVIFTILILGVLVYLSMRTIKKLNFEIEEEVFDMRSKLVRQIKQQNGMPCHFQLAIFMRKIFYSIAVSFLFNYPKAQASIFIVIQILFLVYFYFKQPFQSSKFKVIVQFLEYSFTFFCFLMEISVFLNGESLVSLFSVFGGFLIMFQCIICIIGAYYFLVIAFKLIKIREIIEMQELQKQYDAVKKLQYQDEQNQKQQNFFSNPSQIQGNDQNNMIPIKSTLSISQYPLDNINNSIAYQSNGFQAMNNQTNNFNNSFQAGNHFKLSQANESQLLQNQSIIETKTLDLSSSPCKGGQLQGNTLGYMSYSTSQEQNQIQNKNNIKLPPLNKPSQQQPHHLSLTQNLQQSHTTSTDQYKRQNIVLPIAKENNQSKNNEYIKKKINQLKNQNNSDISSPKHFIRQDTKNKNNTIEMNENSNNNNNNSILFNGSIQNGSQMRISQRDQVLENTSYRNNQMHALHSISQRSDTISFNNAQPQIGLIKEIDIDEDDNDEFQPNVNQPYHNINQKKLQLPLKENPEDQFQNYNKNKEITII